MNTTPTLTDPFGRSHNYLRISLTDRCNLRCFYCMPAEGVELMEKSHIMTIEEIVQISTEFVRLGVNKIRLTGGEPLVRKGADQLIRALGQLPVDLRITTNGILLDRYFDLFKEVGMKTINISLDTFDRERSIAITRRDYYDQIMANIHESIRRGFRTKLNVVLIKGVNDDELLEFVRFTKDHEVNVKFIEFMPFKDNQWDWSKGVGFKEIMETVNAEFSELVKLNDPKTSTSVNYQVKGFKGSFGVIATVTNPFCDSCNRIRLTANGCVKNCLFSNHETDLLTPLRAGQPIEGLIRDNILKKKFSRAGMDTFDSFSDPKLNGDNRSMVAIGG